MSGTQSPVKKSSQQSTEDQPTRLDALEKQNAILAQALSKFATLSGHGNYLKEFGLERWTPSKKDMGKY